MNAADIQRTAAGSEKVWTAAARLWAEQAEAFVEHPVLRIPVLGRVANLVQELLAKLDPAASEREVRRCCVALLGLHTALLRILTFGVRKVPSDVISLLLRALAAASCFACSFCRRAAETRDREQFGPQLLVSVLRCLGSLLEPSTTQAPVLAGDVVKEAVTLLTGAEVEQEEREKDDKCACSKLAPAAAAAALLADGSLGSAAYGVAKALSVVARAMLQQYLPSWSAMSRRRWAVSLVRKLASKGMHCAGGGTEMLTICLPGPLELLCHPGAEDGKDKAVCARGLLASACDVCCSTIVAERSLRLLLAGALNLKQVRGVTKESATITMEQTFSVELPTALPVAWPPTHTSTDSARVCAGLVLAIAARCLEWGASGCAGDHTVLSIRGCATGACRRSELLRVVLLIVRWLATEPDHSAWPGLVELFSGTDSMILALCASWPEGEDEELWRAELVPLVTAWAELLAASVPFFVPGKPTDVPDCSPGRRLDQYPCGMQTRAAALTAARCWDVICAGAGRKRREHLVVFLARRLAVTAMRAVTDSGMDFLLSLCAIVIGLASLLRGMPQRPPLRTSAAGGVISAMHAMLSVSYENKGITVPDGRRDQSVDLHLCAAEVVLNLYAHLGASLQYSGNAAGKKPHKKLDDAEALLLRTAGLLARLALQLRRHGRGDRAALVALPTSLVPADAAGSPQFGDLLASAYSLMSALFAAVPGEGSRLPPWTSKPHIVVDVLKAMLEAVYVAPCGAQAARTASNVARMWEAYAQGGTRLVTQSAGRTGQSTCQARVQRATKGFIIMIIAHALEQQRRWTGIDAAVQRCLRRLDQQHREGARQQELAQWREAVAALELGVAPLLASLEGSEHLKQGLYRGLREPLSTMFKELHEKYQEHGRYHGKA